MRVSSRVTLKEPIFADHFAFLQSCVTTATPKLTIPSPSMVHYRGGRAAIDDTVYPDLDDFWTDLTSAYADEVRALGELGCTYLQFDDTSLAYLNDPKQRDFVTQHGRRPRAPARGLHPPHQRRARRPAPRAWRSPSHLCRGNFQSSWVAQGGYDYVAEALFNDLAVDGFFLEYDDARSGGFEPLRFVPPGKLVVLGLVTTKRGELESKDDLKRRIEEAGALRRRRPALPLGPVRLLLDRRGQRADPRRAVGQARADRRDRARGLGLAGASASARPSARRRRWRAGPVGGHGLRLRKLRLRGVSRATRSSIVLARPGAIAVLASVSVYSFAAAAPVVRPVRPCSPPAYRAAVVCLRVGEPTGSLVVSSHDDTPPLDATARDHRCASTPGADCCLPGLLF